VTKKLKEEQSSAFSCNQIYDQNNPDSESEEDCNEISNSGIDNVAETAKK
jgi:hypothetical protein